MTGPAPRIDADAVRRSVSLLDLLPPGATTRRIGTDKYLTLCMFHSEDRPSLRITLHGGVWRFRCFPCGANGDVFDFLAKTRGLTFGESLRTLAQGRAFDMTVTTTTRQAPGLVLVCDACGSARDATGKLVEAKIDGVPSIGVFSHAGWHIGESGRVLCPSCVDARLFDPHWHGSLIKRPSNAPKSTTAKGTRDPALKL